MAAAGGGATQPEETARIEDLIEGMAAGEGVEAALRRYREAASGGAARMLGRFVAPLGRLEEIEAIWDGDSPLPVSAIASADNKPLAWRSGMPDTWSTRPPVSVTAMNARSSD